MSALTRNDLLNELRKREPIFHRPEFGTTRADFERMVDVAFWEVGASGSIYSRERVLAGVTKRYEDPQYRGFGYSPEKDWKVTGFECRELAPARYLVTYTLDEGDRVTRRCTIWRRVESEWRVLYHQGTIVQGDSR